MSWLPTLPTAAGRDVSTGDLPDQEEEEDNVEEEEEEEDVKLAESSFLQNSPSHPMMEWKLTFRC